MKVSTTCQNGLLKLRFFPSKAEETDSTGKIKMGRKKCSIELPKDWTINSIHPDLFALAVILIIYPFIQDNINVGVGVSKAFHKEFLKSTGKRVVPVDENLNVRIPKNTARPALAFSGGVDSTVALALLPENTCSVFLDRILPKEMCKQKLYDKTAIYNACKLLRYNGKTVYTVKTDLEYIRNPKGFAIEYSSSIPAILLADYQQGFDSISSGTVLESAYLEFKDFNNTRLYSIDWRSLFTVIGLPRNDITTGLSNVATLQILYKDKRYIDIARSCMRGVGNNNCMDCWKCFRKTLITKTLLREPIEDRLIDRLFLIAEARTYLKRLPLRFENQFAYIAGNYSGNHPLMILLRKLVLEDNSLKVDWIDKWYSPSIEHIAPKYREFITNNIKKYVEVMSEEEEEIVSRWDSRNNHKLAYYRRDHQSFVDELIRHKKSKTKSKRT